MTTKYDILIITICLLIVLGILIVAAFIPLGPPKIGEVLSSEPLLPAVEGREIEAEVSAYTISEDETDSEPCISASGVDLCELKKGQEILWIDNWVGSIATTTGIATDKIIACPIKYDFGTIVVIPNGDYYEPYICLDRMNPRYENTYPEKFDILVSSKEEARSFGRQNLKVKIIQGTNK